MLGFQNKQDLYLGQFVNLILQSFIKTNINDSLPDDGTLSEKEIQRFKEELFYLRVQLLMASLMEVRKFGNKEFSNEDIGETTVIALGHALRNTEIPKEEALKELDKLSERIGMYEDYVTGVNEEELQKTGVYFQILQCFANHVLGNDKKMVLTEKGRDKSFTVFSFAKQIYKIDEKDFKEKIKLVKFLD